jgi:hypothetical protein
MLIFGIGLITLGAFLPTLPPSAFNQTDIQGNLTAAQIPIPPPSDSPMALQSFLSGLGIAFGAVLVAIAIVSFVVAYGLLKGK